MYYLLRDVLYVKMVRRVWTRLAVAVFTTLAMFLVAACGSDSAADSEAASGTGGLDGKPIVIGAICSCSGAQSAALGLLKEVSLAWAESVNAGGGINGHPVQMMVEDDGGDPAKALRAAKKLIEEKGVVAIVGDGSVADAAFADYVSKKGVPVVGGLPVESTFLTNPDFFATGSSLPVGLVGSFMEAEAAGVRKMGVLYCAESPVCAQVEGLATAAASLVDGIEVTFGQISATAPDYNAPCLSMKEQGVDGLFVVHNGSVLGRVFKSCAQQGFTPTPVANATPIIPELLTIKELEGILIAAPAVMYTDASVPAVAEFLEALDAYAPGVRNSPQFSYTTIIPWLSGKLFEAAAEVADLSPDSKPADVKRGLYALRDETLDGLMAPTTYVEGKPTFTPCYFTGTIESGAYATPDGSAPKCLTEEKATALGKILADLGS
ncbi:ABC transporter substrate-binding protein [Parafrankia sp. FMc2]|uniref:ABC transporter substrate-binding protein n=1 Tax=Parafrankia sp. FMc2 TaxID=3233196 RepID=UPI0034D694C2